MSSFLLKVRLHAYAVAFKGVMYLCGSRCEEEVGLRLFDPLPLCNLNERKLLKRILSACIP